MFDDATLERTEDVVAMLELLGAIELVVATDERELGVTELVVAMEELLGRELEVTVTLLEVVGRELEVVGTLLEVVGRELEVVGTLELPGTELVTPTMPYGAGCAAQVVRETQLLPFS